MLPSSEELLRLAAIAEARGVGITLAPERIRDFVASTEQLRESLLNLGSELHVARAELVVAREQLEKLVVELRRQGQR